jgi:hypothetical protein
MESFRNLESTMDDLRKQYNRLLELCMYSLIRDTEIYKHELDDVTKLSFMEIIRKNMDDDTYTLRNKLIKAWKEVNYV